MRLQFFEKIQEIGGTCEIWVVKPLVEVRVRCVQM